MRRVIVFLCRTIAAFTLIFTGMAMAQGLGKVALFALSVYAMATVFGRFCEEEDKS